MSLVEQRPLAHDALFGYEFAAPAVIFGEVSPSDEPEGPPSAEIPDEALSMTGLLAVTTRGRQLRLGQHQLVIADAVTRILTDQDEQSRGQDADEAMFGFVDAIAADVVSDLTQDVLMTWDRHLIQNRYGSIIPDDSVRPPFPSANGPFRGLKLADVPPTDVAELAVVETASAVMAVQRVAGKYPPSQKGREDVRRMVANFGPEFAVGWLDGSAITDQMTREGLDADDQAYWLKILDGTTLKGFLRSTMGPYEHLAQFVGNMRLLTDEVIAERTGWAIGFVHQECNTNVRKFLSARYPLDPLGRLDGANERLQQLTTRNIAEVSGLSEAEALSAYPSSARVRYSLILDDPLGFIRNGGNHSATIGRRQARQASE